MEDHMEFESVDDKVSPKNVSGDNGPKCNNCGGYGYTNMITGGARGCFRCDQTGIEPMSNQEIQKRLIELAEKINILIKRVQ